MVTIFSCSSSIRVELKFGVLVFVDKGKTERQRKTLGARRYSTHVWHRAGIEPGPHCWEASALTTAPQQSLNDLKSGLVVHASAKEKATKEERSY